MVVIKNIKKFLTENGESAKADIVAGTGFVSEARVEAVLARMIANGTLVLNGDNYDLAP